MGNILREFCILPLSGCLVLLLMYVLSLYVWQNTLLRNDPSVIKKRFLSVFITSILSPFAIYIFSCNDFASKNNIFDLLGMRFPGLFMASTVPLILTMILFLGPLTMQSQTDNWQLYSGETRLSGPYSYGSFLSHFNPHVLLSWDLICFVIMTFLVVTYHFLCFLTHVAEAPQHNVSPSNMSQMNTKCITPPLKDADGIDKNTTSLKSVNNTSKNASAVDGLSEFSMEDNSLGIIDLPPTPTILPKITSGNDNDGLSSVDAMAPSVDRLNERDNVDDSEPMYWLDSCKDLIWIRDHIVAPFSEELTFRACMLPLLLQCFRSQSAVFICPLFFGMAHFHHIYGRVKTGCKLRTAFLVSGFQFLFTTLFGAYSAFLFLRTGHIIAPFMAHAFCNHIGFPNFREIWFYNEPKRSITSLLCVVGLIAWCCLLEPLTNPTWYKNSIYWKV